MTSWNKSHGMTGTSEFIAWVNMRRRCTDPNHPAYKDYGARGVTVCDEWLDSFETFYRDMGPKPSPELTLERSNNDVGYCPTNCEWATRKTQRANQRKVEQPGVYNGLTTRQLAAMLSVNRSTLMARVRRLGSYAAAVQSFGVVK